MLFRSARGQFEEAERAYRKLETSAAVDAAQIASAVYHQGLCRLKNGQSSAAFALWNRLRAFYPRSPYASQSLWLQAGATDAGRLREQVVAELLAKYPTAPEAALVYRDRGQVAFDQQDYRGAVAAWDRLATDFPQHPAAKQIAPLLATAKRAASGDRAATTEAEVGGMLQRAGALYDHADFKEAGDLYARIVTTYPTASQVPEAACRQARCQLALGKHEDAVATLQRMAERAPGSGAKLLAELVVQTAGLRKFDDVREQATALLRLRYPNSFETQQAMFIAGSVALTRKERESATRLWDDLLQVYPKTVFRTAIERDLKRAAEPPAPPPVPHPKQPTAEELAARRAAEQQRLTTQARKADALWRSAWKTMDERADEALRLARLYRRLDRPAQAREVYEWIWRQTPEHPRAAQAVLEAAQTSISRGDDRQAKELLTYLVNRYLSSPLRPVALYCLGNRQLLYEADLKGAWAYYAALLKDHPTHALADRTRRYWALLQTIKPADLREQLAASARQHRGKSQS